MARPKGSVDEALQVLLESEEAHNGTPQHSRVRMLRILKERPNLTFSQLSDELGCSERSLQRWWGVYRKGGLQALVSTADRNTPGRKRRIDNATLQSLQQQLESEGLGALTGIQTWLASEHGITYSRSGVWNLLRSTVGATPRGWRVSHGADGPRRSDRPGFAVSGVSNQVINFLNALPTSSDVREWGSAFRENLRNLLGDVDRITVNVNVDCRLDDPGEYATVLSIRQNVKDSPSSSRDTRPQDSLVTVDKSQRSPSERLLDFAREQGFPMEKYHAPLIFDYYYKDIAYLATVLLWREIERPAIADSTRHLMVSLKQFMVFVFSDLVARHQADRPVDRVFHDALTFLVDDAHLSPQEERIVILQLMGHSYKEMADMLSVTVDTVKKHFKQIHRKTGTRGQAELFAKYFTSRLISQTFGERQHDNS